MKEKKEMKQEYLKHNGTRCPVCGSDNITCIECVGDSDSKNKIKRTIDCQEVECGAQWNDYYVLSDLEIVFDGKEEEEL